MASPIKLAHLVLRTSQYRTMIDWWLTVLEAEVRHGDDVLTFISYDDEHHRLAIVGLPDLEPSNRRAAGFEHVAFTMADLDTLFDHYGRLRDLGIEPYWTINHGMTLSAYYRDPDGNQVEFQVDTCSLEAADAFMRSPVFAANPIGVEVDFDDLIARRAAGESVESLTAYVPVER